MKFASECAADLEAKVRSVTTLGAKTITVLSMDDLVLQAVHVVKPAAGVLYEGARAVPAEGGKQIGVTGEIVFSVMLIVEGQALSLKVDQVSPAYALLDGIRAAIHGTRAPTGHFWKWVLEAPANPKGNQTVWVQRWTCPVQVVTAK